MDELEIEKKFNDNILDIINKKNVACELGTENDFLKHKYTRP